LTIADKTVSFRICVAGQITIDDLETDTDEIIRPGGTFYAASVFSRLGDSPTMIAAIGGETQEPLAEAAKRGITALPIAVGADPITYVISDADELIQQRTKRFGPPVHSISFVKELPQDARFDAYLIYPVSLDAGVHLAQIARESGALVCADLQHDVSTLDEGRQLLELLDFVFISRSALFALTDSASIEEASAKVREVCKAILVVKMGLAGSLVFTSEMDVTFVPAYLADFKMTVGAGDAFDAAFISRVLRGSSFSDAGTFASKIAAAVVESADADPSASISEKTSLDKRTAVGNDPRKDAPEIYVAGHFHSFPLREYILHAASALENAGFKTFVPHRDGGIVGEEGVEADEAFKADLDALARAKGIVALLDGAYRGGTYFEMGHGYCRSVPIIVWKTDETLGISNMVRQSAKLISNDLRQVINSTLEFCSDFQ